MNNEYYRPQWDARQAQPPGPSQYGPGGAPAAWWDRIDGSHLVVALLFTLLGMWVRQRWHQGGGFGK